MYDIEYRYGCCRVGVLIIILIVYVFGFYWMLQYYTSYGVLIFVLVGVVLVLGLVRMVGLSLLYPGNLQISKGLCLRIDNQTLLCCLNRELKQLFCICGVVQNWVEGDCVYENLLGQNLQQSLRNELGTIMKQNDGKRERIEVIEDLKQILGMLDRQLLGQLRLGMILKEPQRMMGISQESLQELKIVCRELGRLCVQLWGKIRENYVPVFGDVGGCWVNNKFDVAEWDLMGNKLFTMESFYSFWDARFQYQRFVVGVSGGKQIQGAVIFSYKLKQGSDRKNLQKSSVLYSNPNGAYYQCMSTSLIEFYLGMDMNVILWNYRGYSNSTGYASIGYCLEDHRAVYRYVVKNYRLNVQVLHGTSIGGVCAVDLGGQIGGIDGGVKLVIADRTLGGIDLVAKGFIKGDGILRRIVRGFAGPMVRLLFPYDCFDNGRKYLECACQKVCIWDSRDEIICNEGSLKSAIYRGAIEGREYLQDVGVEMEDDVQLLNRSRGKGNVLLQWSNIFMQAMMGMEMADRMVYEKVCGILYDSDGGGQRVYMKIDEGQERLSVQQIRLSFVRYFVGLCLFGCKGRGDYGESMYVETQNRIKKRIGLIEELGQCLKGKKVYGNVQMVCKSLGFAFGQFSQEIVRIKEKKYGKLMVTHIGHNANLTGKHLFALKRIILNAGVGIVQRCSQKDGNV